MDNVRLARERTSVNMIETLVSPLGFDRYWTEAIEALRQRYVAGDSVMGPTEFIRFFDKFYPLHIRRRMVPDGEIDWVLLHKGMRDRLDPAVIECALGLNAHFANEVFVLVGRREGFLPANQRRHLETFTAWKKDFSIPSESHRHAALIITFNRPEFLKRCLRSTIEQFDVVLVVDDGSGVDKKLNKSLALHHGAEYLYLGRNRGRACALNIGFSALLADLDISWISSFDDDTELVSGAAKRIKAIARALDTTSQRNLYSGYASPHHLAEREEFISGERVLFCRSCSGQHMHAHKSYWRDILPIPTAYPRAPKSAGGIFSGQGSEADWWCSNWAPRSAIKKGNFVCVIPDLVRNLGVGHSTWSNAGR